MRNALASFMFPGIAGVATASVFFVALSGYFVPAQTGRDVVRADVPTILYTPPHLKSLAYTDSQLNLDSSILMEMDVDASGRVQNYRIISGRDDAQVREQLNRALLFTAFAPARSFGVPVPGKAVISFSRAQV